MAIVVLALMLGGCGPSDVDLSQKIVGAWFINEFWFAEGEGPSKSISMIVLRRQGQGRSSEQGGPRQRFSVDSWGRKGVCGTWVIAQGEPRLHYDQQYGVEDDSFEILELTTRALKIRSLTNNLVAGTYRGVRVEPGGEVPEALFR